MITKLHKLKQGAGHVLFIAEETKGQSPQVSTWQLNRVSAQESPTIYRGELSKIHLT